MAFEELKLSKDWTNALDFPTYEPDEQQVREDLQYLFSEIRDFINTALVGVLNRSGAEHIVTSSGKDVETVLGELEEAIARAAGGTVPAEGEKLGWDLDMGGHRLTGLAAPRTDGDGATKGYVDLAVQGAVSGLAADVFYAGADAPENTRLLWVDTAAVTGGLKYYNGTGWVHVPVAFA